MLLRCAFEKIQRGGPIGPFPAVDPADRPAAANDRPGPRRGDRRRRLLAPRAGARCRARDRLLRCRRPRGSRSTRGDSQRPPEKPGSWRSPRSTAGTAIGWRRAPAARRFVAERLLARLRPVAALVTVCEFHPASLFRLGAVAGNAIVPLGVDRFGQSGDIPTSAAPTASTPRRSSTPSPAPARRHCSNTDERRPSSAVGSITADLILDRFQPRRSAMMCQWCEPGRRSCSCWLRVSRSKPASKPTRVAASQ